MNHWYEIGNVSVPDNFRSGKSAQYKVFAQNGLIRVEQYIPTAKTWVLVKLDPLHEALILKLLKMEVTIAKTNVHFADNDAQRKSWKNKLKFLQRCQEHVGARQLGGEAQ